ncbi:MAG: hypothetical protein HC854_13480 [Flavobacterium sp.]|nr:hypothetical protein [Flavobacterium sp.]
MQKLAPLLLLLMVLVSCTVEPVDSIQIRTTSEILNTNNTTTVVDDTTVLNNLNIPTFMSANLNGFQYDGLKPMDYVDGSTNESKVEVYTIEQSNYNYLLLQGSDITSNGVVAANSIIIDLRIPQGQWNVGTYDLQDGNSVIMNGNNSCVDLYNLGSGLKTHSITNGSITITEFDTVNRVIRGTFNFTYYIQNDMAVEGPYTLTTGTFNYKLDAPNFL